MDQAVETENLTKRFRERRTLRAIVRRRPPPEIVAADNVSLSVPAGEVFGLVGPNGAGKTTFINLLSTLVTPSAGVARVAGRDVFKDPAGVRRAIGLVTSNERSFYWRLTGRQNLEFFAALYRIPPRQLHPWMTELLEALDLMAFADRRFDSYSTGIRQRFAFARALLHRPAILFMDEPTKGLDTESATALMRLIQQRIVGVWRPTIIITSHNLREIEQLCHRVAIMSRGRILRCGTLEALRRTVTSYETYRLTLGGLPAPCVGVIEAVDGVQRTKVTPNGREGTLHVEVQFAGGGKTLSSVLRAVLAAGGEVHQCNQIPVSLVDVFRHTVSGAEEE